MAPHSSTLAWKIPWTEKPGSDSVQNAHKHTERNGEMLSLSAKPVLIPGCTSESFGKYTHTHTYTECFGLTAHPLSQNFWDQDLDISIFQKHYR